MSHRIVYSSQSHLRIKHSNSCRLPLLTVLCFFLFLIMVHSLWPEGKEILLKMISFREEMTVFSVMDIAAETLSGGGEVGGFFQVLRELFP